MIRPASTPVRTAFVARANTLRVGDRVRTTAHRWETVTALAAGAPFSRSIRVTTVESGPDTPWVWTSQHCVIVHRRDAAHETLVPLPRDTGRPAIGPTPQAA